MFRRLIPVCTFMIALALCQENGTTQQAVTTEAIIKLDIMNEKMTRFILSPMLDKLKEVDRKLEEVRAATETCNQDAKREEVIQSQVLDLTLNVSSAIQELMLKQNQMVLNMTKYMLHQDIYFEAVQPNFGPVLISAIVNGDEERVLALLELGAPKEFKDSHNNRPVHKATEYLRADILEILLNQGADPNSHGKFGYTPLHWTSYNGCFECAKILLTYGALVDSRDNWQDTPLIKSAKYGYDDLVKLFLENGADVNAVQDVRYSALHMAAREGRISTAAILLKHGADSSLKTKWKDTALDFAIKNKHYEIESILRHKAKKSS